MAALRRSRLMRDQWVADEDHRSYRERQEESRSDQHHRSPTSRRAEGSDPGLKIKGRAVLETSQSDSSKHQDPTAAASASKKSRSRDTDHIRTIESKRERPKHRLSKELSGRHLDYSPPEYERTWKRSASPDSTYSHKKQHTRRSRSRDRRDRVADSGTRRSRGYSPHTRRDLGSVTYSRPASQEQLILDSYVPLAHSHRLRSPLRKNPSLRISRRHSPSPVRTSRRSEDDSRRRQRSKGPYSRRVERSISPLINRERDSRASSPVRQKRSEKHRQRSASRPAVKEFSHKRRRLSSRSPRRLEQRDSNYSARSHHSSPTRAWSPSGHKGHRFKHAAKSRHPSYRRTRSPGHYKDYNSEMQSSTRPIQSILDEQPRQPSPPRPIPSFDDATAAGNQHLNQSFPLHGMKSGEVPHNHRRIPPHIDTRQPYATSPQYVTPTSSHHGSPQSGSPYSHGRGGWGGQPHYHGQPG